MSRCNSNLALRLCAFFALLVTSLTAPGFAADQWQMYTSPHGEFKMMMPGPVTLQKRRLVKNMDAQTYLAVGDETRAWLAACPMTDSQEEFETFAGGAKKGITEKGGKLSKTKDVSGPGWSGHLYDYSVKGENASLMVAKVDDSGMYYTIVLNAPSWAPEGKSLYSSFEVVPEKVTSPASDATSSASKGSSADSDEKGIAYKMGYGIGAFLIIGLVLAGLLVPIGVILIVVYIVKQRNNRDS